MEVTKIVTSYRRTFNLGNFNSLSLESQCEVILNKGEDEVQAFEQAYSQCRETVRIQYKNALEDVQVPLHSINQPEPVAPF
jgi:hypothetical protein